MKRIRSSFYVSLAGMFLFNMTFAVAQSSKLVTGTKIDKHVMQNQGDHFAFHDGHVWAQIELKPSTEGHVTFVWTRDGHPYSQLKIATQKSDRYRVAGYVTARPGKWHIIVKSDTDVILAEKDFIVDGMDHTHEIANGITRASLKSGDLEADSSASGNPDKQKHGIADALKAINPKDTASEPKPDTIGKTSEMTVAAGKSANIMPVDVKPTQTTAAAEKSANVTAELPKK